MIDLCKDIRSLTDFKRRSAELVRRMKISHRPIVLTVNGKAELVVQAAADYQRLLEAAERLEAIEGLRRGLHSMKRGKERPATEVFQDRENEHRPLKRRP
jgi:prevent-host-death family protein